MTINIRATMPAGRTKDALRSRLRSRTLRVAAGIVMLLPAVFAVRCVAAFAASTDYDGKWEIENSCSAATGVRSIEPFTVRVPATIENGNFTVDYSGPIHGEKGQNRFSGTFKDSALSIFMDGKGASGGKWHETLSGPVTSTTEIAFDGTHFDWITDKWVLTRTCTGKLRALDSPSAPLSVSNPVLAAAPALAPVASSPVAVAVPAPAQAPAIPPDRTFDGTYSGLVTSSEPPSCLKTTIEYGPIVIRNNHFKTTVFNVGFSIDVHTNGGFNAVGMRRTHPAKDEISGKIDGQTMNLEYQNPHCKAHAILIAGTSPSIPPPPIAQVTAAPTATPVPAVPPEAILVSSPAPLPVTLPDTASAASLSAVSVAPADMAPVPSSAQVPSKSPGATFDGMYSGAVTLSGLPTCQKTIARTLPIDIKRDHFNATIFNVRFSIDVPESGVFNASGVRHTDNAKTDVSGKINGRFLELEMQNPYCKARANLAIANSASSPPRDAAPPPAAALHPRRWSSGRSRWPDDGRPQSTKSAAVF